MHCLKPFVIMKKTLDHAIKLEGFTNLTTSNSYIKTEHEKASIKNDSDTEYIENSVKDNCLESDSETFENLVKEDIEMNMDNVKFEHFDELDENSLDYTPSIVKKSKSKKSTSKVENRIKNKTKPTKFKGPGYCKECKKDHEEPLEGNAKEYPCDLCDKSYKCIRYLKRHEKFHAGKFKCEFCGVAVTTKDVLETHINNRHKGPYPCEICGKLFSSIFAVSKHKVFHGKIIPPKKIEILKCPICEKEFKGKFKLKEHMNCHSTERPHTCDICGASFSHKTSFFTHKKIHSEDEPYSCDVCGKTFKLSQYLAIHKMTHTDITFNCTMCEKSFSSRKGLCLHKKIHTGLGLKHCSFCEKTFDSKYKLTRHERTHSGVKPFHCEACNMSFYSNGELVKHKKLSIRHADNMKKIGGGSNEEVSELKNETTD